MRIKEFGENYRKHSTSVNSFNKCLSMECGDWPIFRKNTSAEFTLKLLLQCKYTKKQISEMLNETFPNNNNEKRALRVFDDFSNGKCRNIKEYHNGNVIGLRWERYKFFTKSGLWKGTQEKRASRFITKEEYDEELQKEITLSKYLDTKTRLENLSKASKIPQKIKVITTAYKRNPNVIVTVLLRANGVCENCNNRAPFIRVSDSSPYLEIHHKIPLAKGGEDTVKNSLALCPNCHRKMHYGQP